MHFPEVKWDDEKAASNFAKHGIRFETASKAFNSLPAELTPEEIAEFHLEIYRFNSLISFS